MLWSLLLGVLHEEVSTIREETAKALGTLGDPRAVTSLVTALQDSDEPVRVEAAKALGQFDDPRASLPSFQPFKMTPKLFGDIITGILDAHRDSKTVDLLIEALQHEHPRVREKAAWILGRIGDPRAVEALIATLQDPNPRFGKLPRGS